uniref:diguanylate cyclase n=1 Tax=Magnetococcus massalia (strain MO-1) TaxID=451514 RepID=A0A1S7LG92_MAGMO|nr:Protein of unknown function. putative diguanylate cyclase with PAS/PAC sensor [Candidatus Magnetococcus massalia]
MTCEHRNAARAQHEAAQPLSFIKFPGKSPTQPADVSKMDLLVRFRSIGTRILVLVGLAVLVGLVVQMFFFLKHQERTILDQNERTMGILAESVSQTLQTAMLSGNASDAQEFSEHLGEVPGVIDFRIYRLDGREAFKDNLTIHAVNTKLDDTAFEIDPERKPGPEAMPSLEPAFIDRVIKQKHIAEYNQSSDTERTLTFWSRVQTSEVCQGCHVEGEQARGLIRLVTSLSKVESEINDTRMWAVIILVTATMVIFLLIWVLIRGSVVKPIQEMSLAMHSISEGDWDQRVPEHGDDELANMARTFNQMICELKSTYDGLDRERNKLSTIILSAKEGMIATDPEGKVVLVNPAAERILDKSDVEIRDGGFFNLIDDPDFIKAYLDKHGIDMPDVVLYKHKMLNIYADTIKDEAGRTVGSAALIRDVTEEKQLEQKLRELSTTDGLTRLINRRRMDELLAEELSRAVRYHQNLSVLLLDVDHFKKFNDTYGHEQGDRVLIALAAEMKDYFRNIDHPCRYGGEEFCVILPNTHSEGAVKVAERLRERIAEREVDGLRVTISIGVSTYPDLSLKKPDEMIRAADAALYESKRRGRNKVTAASAEISAKAEK